MLLLADRKDQVVIKEREVNDSTAGAMNFDAKISYAILAKTDRQARAKPRI